MKKKFTYTLLMAMMALALAGCGGKKDGDAKTDAVEGTIATDDMSDFYATIQKADGNQLTVELDDGSSITVDLSEAHTNPAWSWMPGDEVDIYYTGEGDPTDGMKVAEVQMDVPYENTNSDFSENTQVYGEITALTDDSITVREEEGRNEEDGPQDGTEYTFKRASYGFDIGEPTVGTYAQILYIGELGADDATCFRVLTDDMMDDPASDVYAVQGTLTKLEDDVVYLQCDDATEFKFNVSGDDQLLSDAEVEKVRAAVEAMIGKKVKLIFVDSLRMRVATADSITVVE